MGQSHLEYESITYLCLAVAQVSIFCLAVVHIPSITRNSNCLLPEYVPYTPTVQYIVSLKYMYINKVTYLERSNKLEYEGMCIYNIYCDLHGQIKGTAHAFTPFNACCALYGQ